ncbi:protein bicaudal C homolog 1 isoform X1 [Schistocerca gregaria]|uniref:protein bicaudal C homolog 1 isoform X1 n=2 Tax=Schistocerca gregaria TaxID=7010 RepID=UPI00211EF54B|nr:protein bicaudal C homolog 1 isoform X1 [Schistocerca gregaria]
MTTGLLPMASAVITDPQLDALSEVSSRRDSREDLQELAAALGIAAVTDLKEDRFRVDRRKLEAMLTGENGPQAAEDFFNKVMEETCTHISWPTRLKIGAKSKKDPHIRVAGRPSDVKNAKDMVMSVFDTRSNRVTMKLDVSYTDHSHIIGKGGLTIKKVMEETGCHIHFPDSNRSNPTEKNNQVSISGEMQAVEKARARVRMLTPLIFSFELPVVELAHWDPASAYVQQLQHKYNVQVTFRTRARLNATLVMVKGCEWEVAQVKEATLLLVSHLFRGAVEQVVMQMTIEISPQHHPIVLGKNRENLKLIMQRTGTQILFPDAGDPGIPSLKKSSVNITGTIHNVYKARQQLMGSLPLLLMFDLPEDVIVDLEKINSVMETLDVHINVRHKPKQNTLSLSIKGIERHASKIYEARKLLLSLKEPSVHADIPDSYFIPDDHPVFEVNSSGKTDSEKYDTPLLMNNNYQCSPCSSGYNSPSLPLLSPDLAGQATPWGLSTVLPSLPSPYLPPHLFMQHPSILSSMSCSSGYASRSNSPLSLASESNTCKANSPLSHSTSPVRSPAESPRTKSCSPVQDDTLTNISGLGNALLDLMDCADLRASSCEKKNVEIVTQQTSLFDYDEKRNMALEAIQKPLGTNLRTPTSLWSGYGFSQSSPTPEMKPKHNGLLQDSGDLDPWKTNNSMVSPTLNSTSDFSSTLLTGENGLMSASNYLDSAPTSAVNQIAGLKTKDIASLLTSIGLEKYICIFTNQEIDVDIFRSLTESDLREIGVTALGARRKLLLAISELNKRQSPFSGSAAPGAERKLGSTINNSPIGDKW